MISNTFDSEIKTYLLLVKKSVIVKLIAYIGFYRNKICKCTNMRVLVLQK